VSSGFWKKVLQVHLQFLVIEGFAGERVLSDNWQMHSLEIEQLPAVLRR
jgi:hypothetical protein